MWLNIVLSLTKYFQLGLLPVILLSLLPLKNRKNRKFETNRRFYHWTLNLYARMSHLIVNDKNKIATSITKNEMKEMLILCTKSVHFTFESRTYVQTADVSMGSPLGPVLANVFTIELENSLLPNLTKHIKFWKRYAHDTVCFAKIGTTEVIVSFLNSFGKNIQFTFEEENDEIIQFLDTLISKNRNDITTSVYRKLTCNDIYLN